MNTSNISKSHLTKSDDIIIPIHRDINGFGKSLDQNYDEIVKDRIKIISKLVQQKQEKNLILDEDNSILDMIRTDNSKNIKKIDCNKILVLPSISRKENMTYAMTLKEFLEDENIDPFIELCYLILSYCENIRNEYFDIINDYCKECDDLNTKVQSGRYRKKQLSEMFLKHFEDLVKRLTTIELLLLKSFEEISENDFKKNYNYSKELVMKHFKILICKVYDKTTEYNTVNKIDNMFKNSEGHDNFSPYKNEWRERKKKVLDIINVYDECLKNKLHNNTVRNYILGFISNSNKLNLEFTPEPLLLKDSSSPLKIEDTHRDMLVSGKMLYIENENNSILCID